MAFHQYSPQFEVPSWHCSGDFGDCSDCRRSGCWSRSILRSKRSRAVIDDYGFLEFLVEFGWDNHGGFHLAQHYDVI